MQTQFSTQFLVQLVQRLFKANSPRFFNILTTLFVVAGALLGFITFEEKTFAEAGRQLPQWVGTIKLLLEGLLFIGGPVAAQATIKTPDTPPLASEIEKPTIESLAQQNAELKARLDALTDAKSGVVIMPGSAGTTFTDSQTSTPANP